MKELSIISLALNELEDRGFTYNERVRWRLIDLTELWEGPTKMTFMDLANEYERRYKKDLQHDIKVRRMVAKLHEEAAAKKQEENNSKNED